MTKKLCYDCVFFEFAGTDYFSIEHCKLHNIYPEHRNNSLEVCDDWCKSRWVGMKKVVAVLKALW